LESTLPGDVLGLFAGVVQDMSEPGAERLLQAFDVNAEAAEAQAVADDVVGWRPVGNGPDAQVELGQMRFTDYPVGFPQQLQRDAVLRVDVGTGAAQIGVRVRDVHRPPGSELQGLAHAVQIAAVTRTSGMRSEEHTSE